MKVPNSYSPQTSDVSLMEERAAKQYQLDKLDQKLLRQLHINSRRSVSELARAVQQGRDRVEHRLQRLMTRGIIRRPRVFINPFRLGLSIFKIYIRFKNHASARHTLMARLNAHPAVSYVSEVSGRWDLQFLIYARSTQEFRSFYQSLCAGMDPFIQEYFLALVDEQYLERKSSVPGCDPLEPLCISAAKDDIPALAKIDHELLHALAEDSMSSTASLARLCTTTEAIIRYRLKKLEDSGVIAKFGLDVDLGLIGITGFKALVHFSHFDSRQEDKFREACFANPYITKYDRQFGVCSVEFEIETSSLTLQSALVADLSHKFPKLVTSMETLVMHSHSHFLGVSGEHQKVRGDVIKTNSIRESEFQEDEIPQSIIAKTISRKETGSTRRTAVEN